MKHGGNKRTSLKTLLGKHELSGIYTHQLSAFYNLSTYRLISKRGIHALNIGIRDFVEANHYFEWLEDNIRRLDDVTGGDAKLSHDDITGCNQLACNPGRPERRRNLLSLEFQLNIRTIVYSDKMFNRFVYMLDKSSRLLIWKLPNGSTLKKTEGELCLWRIGRVFFSHKNPQNIPPVQFVLTRFVLETLVILCVTYHKRPRSEFRHVGWKKS